MASTYINGAQHVTLTDGNTRSKQGCCCGGSLAVVQYRLHGAAGMLLSHGAESGCMQLAGLSGHTLPCMQAVDGMNYA